jgi:hypothetical protein
MGPFLLIVLLWIGSTLAFSFRRKRTLKHLASLFLFPLAFGILAVGHWALHWNVMYEEMERSGFQDELQHIQWVLVVTRSTFMVVIAAAVSLITTAFMFLLPCRDLHQAEAVDGKPPEAPQSPR